MRVAALYDIHGNLPALEAVLREVRHAKVDRVLVGGDVLPGPLPCETLRALNDIGAPVDFIYGNGEVAVLEQVAGRESHAVPEAYRPIIRWNADQIRTEFDVLIAAWPKTFRLCIEGLGDVLFCHATPRSEDECFTRLTPEERLLPIFGLVGADVVICGHTHMQFDRMVGNVRVVNAGSVGMPFGESGADWLLLGPDVEPRHTAYDLSEAAARIRASSCPQADEFFAQQILEPPSAVQMLDAFTRASI